MDIYANYKVFKTEFAGRPLVVETGKFAGLANGSCMIRYGDTCVLATATASAKPRDGIDFFPLAVDYEEKLYSVGKIPGGFLKREGKPSEKAILTSRVIDRPIRPLFPKDMRNDVVISTTPMAVNNDYSPEITAMNGASVAIAISDIPWNGPIAGVILGYVDGEYVLNPTLEQKAKSQMMVTIAATEEKIVMIEAGANEVPDDIMLKGIIFAHQELKKLVRFIKDIAAEIGKPKFEYQSSELDHDMYEDIKSFCLEKVEKALDTDDKDVRDANMAVVEKEVREQFDEKYPECPYGEVLYKIQKEIVRRWLFDDHRRVDGRGLEEIRPLHAEVGVLPRVHGSGLFSRGQTQVLTVATLGPIAEKQKLDGVDEEDSKRYMHHYNMPGYSVGDAKSSRGAGRREIGHGALAERSLEPVLPSEEEFPYAIRLVSEVLSSNGSTSQASVCGSTLALMDAGVPIKRPVAGIAMGLIKDTESGKISVLSDIQGLEDFLGDMDFKVAGTVNGITAIQMDIKIKGISEEILRKAIKQANEGRHFILGKMLECIPAPNAELSKYAPKIISFNISTDKIKDVIGSGGKTINKIIDETGVKIDINEDGKVCIATYGEDLSMAEKAKAMIMSIARDPEVGDMFISTVVRILPKVGAFCELAPGKDGMIHISKMSEKRINSVDEVLAIGDTVKVEIIKIGEKGIDLKLLEKIEQA